MSTDKEWMDVYRKGRERERAQEREREREREMCPLSREHSLTEFFFLFTFPWGL